MKEILLGALTAAALVLLLCLVSSIIIIMQENDDVHAKISIVTEKMCSDEILGSTVSKIKDSDGVIYFIPNDDCNQTPIGYSKEIIYNRINQGNAPERFSFNRVVGNYP
jgi:hypothetical protein